MGLIRADAYLMARDRLVIMGRCIAQLADGTVCGRPTELAGGESLHDTDLCPEHRAEMAAQRDRASRLPALSDRLVALESLPVIAMNKPAHAPDPVAQDARPTTEEA